MKLGEISVTLGSGLFLSLMWKLKEGRPGVTGGRFEARGCLIDIGWAAFFCGRPESRHFSL